MTLRRKIAVLSVIAFGASAVIVACFRLIPLLELYTSPDASWVLGKMVVVASLEIQLAVVASNLPSMKALWLHWTRASAESSGGQSGEGGIKLGSVERRGGKRGSVTVLERGGGNESEEELTRAAMRSG